MVTGVLARDTSLSAGIIRNNADRVRRGEASASTNTAAFSKARGELNAEILPLATRMMASSLAAIVVPNPTWEGFIPFAIDGTTLTAADTKANQAAFPQHGSQAEGVGFPLIRAVLLQDLVTGAIHDVAYGPFKGKETGEMSLARQVLSSLPERSLLLGDRYFPSYFLMAELIKRGLNGLFPMHAARDVDFRHGKKVGPRDHLVEWPKPQRPAWMSEEEYRAYPDTLTLREVDLTREVRTGSEFVVVTTLLDHTRFRKGKLAKFYKKRWRIESALKDLKDTFHLDHIAAKSPEMVRKVIWAHLLAYNCLRWHMVNASLLYERAVDAISVKTAARIVVENRANILSSNRSTRPALFADLYEQMILVPVGQRPGRAEPRAVKKRPKPFPRLTERRSDWHKRMNA